MPAVKLIEGSMQASRVFHPLRLRLLEELREPDSASGLARRMSIPRQRLNYHLRTLEKEGLLELVEERRRGNCNERVLRATARAFIISPRALGAISADPEAVQDRFSSSYLVAVAARAIQDIGRLRAGAEAAGRKLGTFTLQGEVRVATAAARKAFMEELTREVARLTAKYHDEEAPGGRRFQFIIAGYPSVAATQEEPDTRGGQQAEPRKENEP